MATFKEFEEIEAWKTARELTRAVYRCSKVGAFARDYALRDQVRRAASSVMSNIAEGFERGGNAEFIQFLTVARGSAAEVQSLLYVALDEDYITREQFDKLKSLAGSARRLITGLVSYLRRSGIRGSKFKGAVGRRSNRKPETGNRKPE